MTNYRILLATAIPVFALALLLCTPVNPVHAAVIGSPSGGAVPQSGSAVGAQQTGGAVGQQQTGGAVGQQQTGGAVGQQQIDAATGVLCTGPDNVTVQCQPGYSCDTSSGLCLPPTTTSGGAVGQQAAQSSSGSASSCGGNTLCNPLGAGTSLTTLIADIMSLVTRIGIVIVILMLVYVGFLFVTAQGNESKLTQAKTALMWTVIGALILLGAQAIAYGIQATAQALSVGG